MKKIHIIFGFVVASAFSAYAMEDGTAEMQSLLGYSYFNPSELNYDQIARLIPGARIQATINSATDKAFKKSPATQSAITTVQVASAPLPVATPITIPTPKLVESAPAIATVETVQVRTITPSVPGTQTIKVVEKPVSQQLIVQPNSSTRPKRFSLSAGIKKGFNYAINPIKMHPFISAGIACAAFIYAYKKGYIEKLLIKLGLKKKVNKKSKVQIA